MKTKIILIYILCVCIFTFFYVDYTKKTNSQTTEFANLTEFTTYNPFFFFNIKEKFGKEDFSTLKKIDPDEFFLLSHKKETVLIEKDSFLWTQICWVGIFLISSIAFIIGSLFLFNLIEEWENTWKDFSDKNNDFSTEKMLFKVGILFTLVLFIVPLGISVFLLKTKFASMLSLVLSPPISGGIYYVNNLRKQKKQKIKEEEARKACPPLIFK